MYKQSINRIELLINAHHVNRIKTMLKRIDPDEVPLLTERVPVGPGDYKHFRSLRSEAVLFARRSKADLMLQK